MDLNFMRKQSFNKGKSSSLMSSNTTTKQAQKQLKLVKNSEKMIESLDKIDVISLDKGKNGKMGQKPQNAVKLENQNVNKIYLKNHKKSQFENEAKVMSISLHSIDSQKKNKTKINEINQIQQQKKKRSSAGYKINLNIHQKSKENDTKPQPKPHKEKEEDHQDSNKLKMKIKTKDHQIQKMKKEVHEKEALISRLTIQHQLEKEILEKEKQYLKSQIKVLTKELHNYKKTPKQSQRSLEEISIKKIQLYVDKNKSTLSRSNIIKKQTDKHNKPENLKQMQLLALNQKLNQNLKISQQKLKDKEAEQKMAASENIYLKQLYQTLQYELNLKIQQLTLNLNKLNQQNIILKQNEQQHQKIQTQLKSSLESITNTYNEMKSNYENLESNYSFLENDQQLKISQQQYDIKTKQQQIQIHIESIKELQKKLQKFQQQLQILRTEKIQSSNQLIDLQTSFEAKIKNIQEYKLQLALSQKKIQQSLGQNLALKNQINELNQQKNKLEQNCKKVELSLVESAEKYKQQSILFAEERKKNELEIKSKENLLTEIVRLQTLRTEQYQEKSNTKIKELLDQIRRLQQQLEKSYYQKQDLESQYDHLYKSFSDQQEAYEKLTQKHDKNLERLDILTLQLQKKENYIQKLNMQLEQSEDTKNMLSTKINSSQCESCNQLTKELNKITSEFQTYKYASKDKLDRLEDQKQELRNMLRVRTISGIHSADILNQQ